MKKLLLGTFLGTAMLLIVQVSTVFACQYNGAWLPNSGDVNYISVNALMGIDNPYELWIYDFNDPDTKIKVLEKGKIDSGATVLFNLNTTWEATGPYSSINLGCEPDFGIFFKDDSGTEYFEYDLISRDEGKTYQIKRGAMSVLQVDAEPKSIPDPSVTFLLGSACLVGFGGGLRRKLKG